MSTVYQRVLQAVYGPASLHSQIPYTEHNPVLLLGHYRPQVVQTVALQLVSHHWRLSVAPEPRQKSLSVVRKRERRSLLLTVLKANTVRN